MNNLATLIPNVSPELFQVVAIILNGVLIPMAWKLAATVSATNERLAGIEQRLHSGDSTHNEFKAELAKIRLDVVRLEIEFAALKAARN